MALPACHKQRAPVACQRVYARLCNMSECACAKCIRLCGDGHQQNSEVGSDPVLRTNRTCRCLVLEVSSFQNPWYESGVVLKFVPGRIQDRGGSDETYSLDVL